MSEHDGNLIITVHDLTVRHGSITVLSHVSEQVEAGAWVCLIGANGAGKTTLLTALAGLRPTGGTVRLGGVAVDDLRPRDRARLVAYVPQTPVLPPDMTVGAYVLLGRTAHRSALRAERPADRRAVATVLARLDLECLAHRRLAELSGGEVQRAVLARAVAQDAPVLLLDEPTSALDVGRQQVALDLVDELRRERGLTVVTAMHDLTLASQYADRLSLLAGGRIVARGAPADVLRPDVLAVHYGANVHVIDTPDGGLAVVPSRATLTVPA